MVASDVGVKALRLSELGALPPEHAVDKRAAAGERRCLRRLLSTGRLPIANFTALQLHVQVQGMA